MRPCRGLEHELPDGSAHGQQLRAIHAPNDLTDDRRHDLLDAQHSEVRRLFHQETWLGKFERLHEVVVQAAVRQLHYDIRKGVAVCGGIRSVLDSTE